MCNLYSITKSQDAIRRLFGVTFDSTGNLPSMPGVFPDYEAPVVRNHESGPELIKMRWGMPPPPKFGGPPVTNIRNTSSPHWRGWLKPENRCLVPVSSFSEYAPEPNPITKKKDVVWFALDDSPTPVRLRRHLDRIRRARHQIQANPRTASGLWILDHRAECRRGAHSPEGNAGDIDDGPRTRGLVTRTVGRSQSATATPSGRRSQDRYAGTRQGR